MARLRNFLDGYWTDSLDRLTCAVAGESVGPDGTEAQTQQAG